MPRKELTQQTFEKTVVSTLEPKYGFMPDGSPRRAKVHIVGLVGHGKTSIQRTILSAYKGAMDFSVRILGGGETVTTQVTQRQPVANLKRLGLQESMGGLDEMQVPFLLVDHEGVQMNEHGEFLNYSDGKLNQVAAGHVPVGFETTTAEWTWEKLCQQPGPEQRPDVVIVVADINIVTQETCQKALKKIVKAYHKHDVNAFLFLTKPDELDSEIADDPAQLYQSEEVTHAVKAASNGVGIPRNQVFPVCNYESQDETEVEIDAAALIALETVLRGAEDKIRHECGVVGAAATGTAKC